MENHKLYQLEQLKLDKHTLSELTGTHMKWVKFLVVSQTALALLNGTLLLAGTLLYGKEAVTILRKRMETQE